jgi:outer membrane protein insertion porin family
MKGPTDQKKDLIGQLQQQLHDSIQVRKVRKLIFFQTLNHPPVFDTINAGRSIEYMRALLNSLGYYRDSSYYRYRIDTISSRQLETKVNFYVHPGVLTTIDSIKYKIAIDTLASTAHQLEQLDTLQKLTDSSLNEAAVKQGDAFSKYLLSSERDRLSEVYRNNGYLKYSQEEMLILWDTVGLALIRPTLDPIEQARQLEQLKIKREHPTADVEFRLRASGDTTRITRYYVGKVTVFPDFTTDTAYVPRKIENLGEYTFISYQGLFRPDELTEYIFLHRGALYRQSNLLRTQNKFSSLGSWRLINIAQLPRPGEDTVDFEIRLTPSRKYAFTANLEGSRNQGNLSIAEGNLIGLGITLGLQNRNYLKAANQAVTNFRYGTELNATTANLVQTQQFTISHTITFPRFVPHIPWLHDPEKDEDVRTIFSLNGGITDRVNYYNLTTFNTSWGYNKSWHNKLLGIRLPNIEYNYIIRRDTLNALIRINSSYKYIFNTGLIVSSLLNFSIAGGSKYITKLTSASLELPILPVAIRSDFYRFIKLDAEYRQTHKLGKNAFAWRFFGGVGVGLPFSNLDSLNFYLPFFRSYYLGGPNSMRAWGVRRLGPGSAIRLFSPTEAPDRFGDLRLEANAEYRIYLFTYNGIAVNTALFTDIGNVWFLRYNKDFPGGEFRFNKLGKDIAIGTGTGLRLDFGFLKVRFDYAYKVKDPTPEKVEAQNKWFYNWALFNGQFQLGIDYPF